ncbi:hypothetical protein B0J14DRAFT_574245, partial [Halenospora varia]
MIVAAGYMYAIQYFEKMKEDFQTAIILMGQFFMAPLGSFVPACKSAASIAGWAELWNRLGSFFPASEDSKKTPHFVLVFTREFIKQTTKRMNDLAQYVIGDEKTDRLDCTMPDEDEEESLTPESGSTPSTPTKRSSWRSSVSSLATFGGLIASPKKGNKFEVGPSTPSDTSSEDDEDIEEWVTNPFPKEKEALERLEIKDSTLVDIKDNTVKFEIRVEKVEQDIILETVVDDDGLDMDALLEISDDEDEEFAEYESGDEEPKVTTPASTINTSDITSILQLPPIPPKSTHKTP